MHELDELKIKHERFMMEAASAQAQLQAQVKDYVVKVDRLERHRTLLMGQARESEEKEAERKSQTDIATQDLKAQVRSLRAESSALKDKNVELAATCRQLEHETAQARASATAEEGNAVALEAELERLQQELGDKAAETLEERERRRLAEAECERIKAEKSDTGNALVIREELHRQVEHLKTLEKENSKLSRRVETYEKQHANLELLKERNKALEKKASALDALRRQAAGFEAEIEELKRERKEWTSYVDGEQTTPQSLSKTLAATRIENATYREKLDRAGADLERRDRIIGELEARSRTLEQDVMTEKTSRLKLDANAKQEHARHSLLVKEIDMLKRHLATFSTEAQIAGESNLDAEKSARVEELEGMLEAYKAEVTDISKQVAHWRGLVERYGGSTTEIVGLEERSLQGQGSDDDTGVIVSRSLEDQLRKNESLQNDLDEARKDSAMMVKEIESLELRVDRLTYAHGNGEYDPTTTKVLQLRDNPDSQEHAIRTATLDRLRQENAALLSTIEELETRKNAAAGASAPSAIPRESFQNLQAELENALATVKQKETMEVRLKKAFADKADEFRKAVQSLLGFRLDFLSSGRVRVLPVYAPTKEYSILFGSSSGGLGTMELTSPGNNDDPLTIEIRQMVKYWVDERKCIPAFLAALSMFWIDKEEPQV